MRRKKLLDLPLPSLSQTCESYLSIVKPFLNTYEQIRTEKIVRQFENEEAPPLQALLEKLAETSESSYVSYFWQQKYLEDRLPLVFFQNPGFLWNYKPFLEKFSFSELASIIIHETVKLYLNIKNNNLELSGKKNRPLCVAQYSHIFGRTRIPGRKQDHIVNYFNSTHVILIYNGNFYKIECMLSDTLLETIEMQIKSILNKSLLPAAQIGFLTTQARSDWVKTRQILLDDPINNNSLTMIENALFIFCLDDVLPQTLEEASTTMLCGNGYNRWFDKSIQLILTKNGFFGINFEHSEIDGTPLVELGQLLYERIKNTEFTLKCLKDELLPNTLLPWKISHQLQEIIFQAKKYFENLKTSYEINTLEFQDNMSDVKINTLAQLAMQLAYTRLYNKIPFVHQSVHTRYFHHGRTEALRSVTSESVALVQSILSNQSPEFINEALSKAVKAHKTRQHYCMQGLGVDRHLLALYQIAKEQNVKVPSLFHDYAYKKIFSKNSLCTSPLLGVDGFLSFSFTPHPKDELGIAYVLHHDKKITFSIIGKPNIVSDFTFSLHESLKVFSSIKLKCQVTKE